MGGINSVLGRGLDGLNIASRALQVASNNMANVNTKGYARQQIIIGQRDSAQEGSQSYGQGAEVSSVQTVVSPFIEMQLFENSKSYGYADGRRVAVSQLEGIWNDSQNNGIGKTMGDFFNTLSELSKKPEDTARRRALVDTANLLTDQFQNTSKQIKDLRTNLSTEISSRITTINTLSESIADMNQTISERGGPDVAQDLVSQRQDLLRQLAEEVNVSYYQDSDGNMQVSLSGGNALVDRFNSGTLALSDDQSYGASAAITCTAPNTSSAVTVTGNITSGRLGGNLYERNTTLNAQIASLDTLAYQFASQFNAIHSGGGAYGLDGSTGNNFFAPLGSATDAAHLIAVDSNIANNVSKIALSSSDPLGASGGNNTIALSLIALRTTKGMASGTQTFNEYYRDIVGGVGTLAASVQADFDRQSYLLEQTQTQRESISGVNMDEESANIIQYQKVFQASARIISIADSLMDSVLGIGR